jgi:hypothetical protein
MEVFTKNNITALTHPPYFSLFPRMKKKFKVRHFDTIKVIETEHDSQDAFTK